MRKLKIQSCFLFVLSCLPRCGNIEFVTSAHLFLFLLYYLFRNVDICMCMHGLLWILLEGLESSYLGLPLPIYFNNIYNRSILSLNIL